MTIKVTLAKVLTMKENQPPARKTYGLRLAPDLMRELQYIGVDQDRWISDMVEEAIRDFIKKHHGKRKDAR